MLGWPRWVFIRRYLRESWFGVVARQAVGFALGWVGLVVLYYLIPEARIGRGILALALLIGFIALGGIPRAGDAPDRCRCAEAARARARRRIARRTDSADDAPPRGPARLLAGRFRAAGRANASWFRASASSRRDGPLHLWAKQHQVNEIVVGPDERRGGLPMEELLECKQRGIFVTDLATFFERESGKVKLSLAEPSWLVFSQGFDASPLRRFSKRGFDLASRPALVLLLTWPFMLLVALADPPRIRCAASRSCIGRNASARAAASSN